MTVTLTNKKKYKNGKSATYLLNFADLFLFRGTSLIISHSVCCAEPVWVSLFHFHPQKLSVELLSCGSGVVIVYSRSICESRKCENRWNLHFYSIRELFVFIYFVIAFCCHQTMNQLDKQTSDYNFALFISN